MHAEHDNEWSLKVIDLDKMEDGALIQMELLTRTGQKTVPNIFIDQEHIGGDSELTKLHSKGMLEPKLKAIKRS